MDVTVGGAVDKSVGVSRHALSECHSVDEMLK